MPPPHPQTALPADIPSLQEAYQSGSLTPATHLESLFPFLTASGPTFIHLEPLPSILKRCTELQNIPEGQRGILWGIPCAVKDNVDVQGMPTTAACPAFSYTPQHSALAVQAVQDAGAIIVGKTNMDQFAAGLVGTRSPYGVPANAWDSRFVPGGSSSGSAVAVAARLVSFALGTDTAGSGRVPAGLNGCVGIKGTVGMISTKGVVPACAALDCLTVFAATVADGAAVMRVMEAAGRGPEDVWRRSRVPVQMPPASGFSFAVPASKFLDWSCPGAPSLAAPYQDLFDGAVVRLKAAGGIQVDVDFEPLCEVAAMLYGSSFVAERYSGIRKFLEAGKKASNVAEASDMQLQVSSDTRLLSVTRHIIAGAGKFTAADVYDDQVRLATLRARAVIELAKADMLLVPTALAHFTVDEVQAEENQEVPGWSQNAKLGRFTNFVNLLDMCGVAVPAGAVAYDAAAAAAAPGATDAERDRAEKLASSGPSQVVLPFGVTLLTKAWMDEWLWGVATKAF